MTNSYVAGAGFLAVQGEANKRLSEKYAQGALAEGRRLVMDKMGEPVLWVKDGKDLMLLVKTLRADPVFAIDYLSDLTAYDNQDGKDGAGRFVLVVQLHSLTTHVRVRLKLLLAEGQEAPTLTGEWLGANWLEREVYDMYGIRFTGHPNLRRIMMDERFTAHPLRKEYPIKQRETFKDNIPLHLGNRPLPVSKD